MSRFQSQPAANAGLPWLWERLLSFLSFPTPNPPAFSHARSFSTSTHHTATHSILSSPGLSYASLNDDDMLSLSILIPTGLCGRRATRKLAHIGEHVHGALIYMLELRYPHRGLCVEHWKALRIIQDRYRFWAAPFRDRLISYDAPVPGLPPPGPSPPDTSSLGREGPAPPVQPDMFDDIVVEPPPAPPASTPGSAPAPPPPPPVMTLHVSKGKLCTPHSKHFTACNLHLTVYCVDVPCSEADYKIKWSRLQSEDAARVKVYEEYANTLKNSKSKPTEIPVATVIRKCIEELLAEQNI
ncbi:hypothetical protein DFH08DRAFT_963001 [Mycena albidolilacea]|uniref:Uncharacterized protein n=1 Tax=Mycena albidolilacea TaxID=1033008 RepID=A0AAD6ZXS7_9AGAR|nr:hypothetical protein DFH08DRAFT_963001 [Mycena albidolilacea]